ncbi:MAG: SCO family protein [Saprospiraceae bacterium]
MLGSLLLVACQASVRETLPYYHTPDFTPVWPAETGEDVDTLHRIRDFHMVDQSGTEVSLETFQGDILVVNFFFTACPSICPTLTTNIKTVADATMDLNGIRFLSFSVTPDRDSVPRLASYAERFDLPSDRWHLLTGDQDDIYTLARRSFFAEQEMGYDRDSQEFLHKEHVLLVDPDRHLRGIYKGTLPLDMQALLADLRTLIAERHR